MHFSDLARARDRTSREDLTIRSCRRERNRRRALGLCKSDERRFLTFPRRIALENFDRFNPGAPGASRRISWTGPGEERDSGDSPRRPGHRNGFQGGAGTRMDDRRWDGGGRDEERRRRAEEGQGAEGIVEGVREALGQQVGNFQAQLNSNKLGDASRQ